MITYKLYSELQKEHSGPIPYAILLTAQEWKKKRNEIISRENNTCQICNSRCADDYILESRGNFVYEVPATVEEFFDYPNHGMELVKMFSPKIAHVHHTYYVSKVSPWDYPNESLQLLCHDCHYDLHKKNKIMVYNNREMIDGTGLTPCDRCSGTGYLQEFNHVFNGICFKCNGRCFNEWAKL
jgi:hypothetical protein